MKTSLQEAVEIQDDDRNLTITVVARYTYSAGCPVTGNAYHGYTPGEAANVDVHEIDVLDVVTWIGDIGVSSAANIAELDAVSSRHIADEIQRKYASEIEAAVLEAHQQAPEFCGA